MLREKKSGKYKKWLLARLLRMAMCHLHVQSQARTSHTIKSNVIAGTKKGNIYLSKTALSMSYM